MQQPIEAQVRQYDSYLQEWNAGYAEYAKSVGLSFTSLSILETLYGADACTQKQLCAQCFLPKQTVNAVITAFYKRGWVQLDTLPEDRRNKLVRLTQAGRTEAARMLQPLQCAALQAMQQLSESERALLLAATRHYVLGCREAMKGL